MTIFYQNCYKTYKNKYPSNPLYTSTTSWLWWSRHQSNLSTFKDILQSGHLLNTKKQHRILIMVSVLMTAARKSSKGNLHIQLQYPLFMHRFTHAHTPSHPSTIRYHHSILTSSIGSDQHLDTTLWTHKIKGKEHTVLKRKQTYCQCHSLATRCRYRLCHVCQKYSKQGLFFVS